jgi:hypothetical protein
VEENLLLKLYQILLERFSDDELRTLCNLYIHDPDYDDLAGEGKANKARELVTYLQRRCRTQDLVSAIQQSRPDIPLEDIKTYVEHPNERSSADSLFRPIEEMPKFESLLARHEEIWMSAKDLHTFISTYDATILDAAAHGKRFRFLIVDPKDATLMKALAASSWLYPATRMRESMQVIAWFREMITEAPDNIVVRLANCIPSSALQIADSMKAHGQMIVTMYGYKIPRNKRLHIHLTRATDNQTFEYYLEQFEQMWRHAEPLTTDFGKLKGKT